VELSLFCSLLDIKVAKAVPQSRRKYTPDGEKAILTQLIEKHGEDLSAMARDKLNKWQNTAAQLKKKIAQLHRTGTGKMGGYLADAEPGTIRSGTRGNFGSKGKGISGLEAK
jgi:hypothetical protein